MLLTTIMGSLYASTLPEVIHNTLQSNPEVHRAVQARYASEQNLKVSKSDYYPEIFIAAGVGNETTDSPFTRGLPGNPEDVDLTRRETALVIRQLLYDGFATSQTVATSKSRLTAASTRVLAVVENITLRTSQAYIDVMRQDKLLQLAKDNLKEHEKIYQRVKQRADRGVGRKADLDQAEGRVALARSQVVASEANFYNARVNYIRIVGEQPPADMTMPESLANALPVSIDEAVRITRKNNPEIQSAMAEVMVANAQYKVARSNLHPQLDLVYEQTWDENLDGIEGENEGYNIMLQFKYNLFNGGGDSARSRQARFQIDESMAQQDSTERRVLEDLNVAWITYKAVRNQLIYLSQHVEASIQTQAAYEQQFSLGARTLLDLLDARNEVFQAERAYQNAQYDSLYKQYNVLAVMGALARQFNGGK